MPDPAPNPPADPKDPPAGPPADPPGDPADLGENGKKALDAERRRAATAERELKAAKARLDEIEAANLTELQKAQKAAADAQTQLKTFEVTNIRQRVALAKGLPADLVDRLRGDTEAEIAADADSLLELVGKKGPNPPNFDGGPRPPAGGPTDMNNLIRRAAGLSS